MVSSIKKDIVKCFDLELSLLRIFLVVLLRLFWVLLMVNGKGFCFFIFCLVCSVLMSCVVSCYWLCSGCWCGSCVNWRRLVWFVVWCILLCCCMLIMILCYWVGVWSWWFGFLLFGVRFLFFVGRRVFMLCYLKSRWNFRG